MGNFKWYRRLRGGMWYLVSNSFNVYQGEKDCYWVRGCENIPAYFRIEAVESH